MIKEYELQGVKVINECAPSISANLIINLFKCRPLNIYSGFASPTLEKKL